MKQNLFRTSIIASTFVLLSALNLEAYKSKSSPNKCEKLFRTVSVLEATKSEKGFFSRASGATHELISKLLEESKKNSTTEKAKVKRVEKNDIEGDLSTIESDPKFYKLAKAAIKSTHYITSAAGLWSRGVNQVKALVPINLSEVLSRSEISELEYNSKIATAKTPQDAYLIKHPNAQLRHIHDSIIQSEGMRLISESKLKVEELLEKARKNPKTLNALDMKFANIALTSEKYNVYMTFDIWTSEQTHQQVSQYVKELKLNYKNKVFSENPATNDKIIAALGRYFKESDRLGETHLFGMQKGVHAFDPKTFEPLYDTNAIGEGAGMLKTYLDESGRTKQLLNMGKKNILFDNIEVLTDLENTLAAHRKAGKKTSVVVVEEKPGYSGGNPFIETRANGTKSVVLYEQSAIDKELASGNKFFNTNTMIFSMTTPPFYSLGFENKVEKGRPITRVKLNAGNVTFTTTTAALVGRIGIDYENFKTYIEYSINGSKLINSFRDLWDRKYINNHDQNNDNFTLQPDESEDALEPAS